MTVPFPFAPVINVSSHLRIRLISIPDDKVAQLTKFRGVEAYTLPTGMYKGIDYPVKGIAVRAHLVVGDDMPDELAYAIVKASPRTFRDIPLCSNRWNMPGWKIWERTWVSLCTPAPLSTIRNAAC